LLGALARPPHVVPFGPIGIEDLPPNRLAEGLEGCAKLGHGLGSYLDGLITRLIEAPDRPALSDIRPRGAFLAWPMDGPGRDFLDPRPAGRATSLRRPTGADRARGHLISAPLREMYRVRWPPAGPGRRPGH